MSTRDVMDDFRVSFVRTFRTTSSEIYDMVLDGKLVGVTNVHIGRRVIKVTMSFSESEIDEERAVLAMHLLNLLHLEGIEVDSEPGYDPRVMYEVAYADGSYMAYGFDENGNLLDVEEEDEEEEPLAAEKQYVYYHPRVRDSLIAYPTPIAGLKEASIEDVLEDEFFEESEIGSEFVVSDGAFLYLGAGEFKKIR